MTPLLHHETGTNARDKTQGRLLLTILKLFFRLAQLLFHGLLALVYNKPGDALPPINNLILMDSAFTLAQKIRNRKLTSVEVVQSFITRIKEVNKILNAVVDNRFDEALEEARKADEYITTSGKTKEEIAEEFPLLGVPFTVKDCISIKGLSFTGGLYARRNIKAEEDAEVIRNMKKGGAIALGVTNVSELCMWWEANNTVYGRTNNPYNTNRIVGGSSGGEGCILAAAGSPVGIGSDIGGSVRIPAFFNGVFGHKPSTGVGSHHGHHPVPREALQRSFLTAGPMSRFATDLLPMMKIMVPEKVQLLQLDKPVDVSKLKYFYMEDDGGGALISPVEPEIKECVKKIVSYLQTAHGIKAEQVHIPEMKQSMTLWFGKMKAAGEPQMASELTNNKGKANIPLELLKMLFGLSHHTFPVLAVGLLEMFNMAYGSPKHQHLVQKADDLKSKFLKMLGTNAVFLYPTQPTAAPYHIEPIVKPFNVAYTAIYNILGLPSTSIPMGLNKQGLPIGIQVVAGLNQDRLTMAVAEELEKAFGGWVPPS